MRHLRHHLDAARTGADDSSLRSSCRPGCLGSVGWQVGPLVPPGRAAVPIDASDHRSHPSRPACTAVVAALPKAYWRIPEPSLSRLLRPDQRGSDSECYELAHPIDAGRSQDHCSTPVRRIGDRLHADRRLERAVEIFFHGRRHTRRRAVAPPDGVVRPSLPVHRRAVSELAARPTSSVGQ